MAKIPLIKIAKVANMTKYFTAFDSPIWRARLWIRPYIKNLPFMADSDPAYNNFPVLLENIIIDFVEYWKAPDYSALRNRPESWMLDPNDDSTLYIHFANHSPSFSFLSFRAGKLSAFSYGKPAYLGVIQAYPYLLSFPEIEDTADPVNYQRMAFSSGTVEVDNSKGQLDEFLSLFGNNLIFSLFDEKNAEAGAEIVRTFFITNYQIGMERASFNVQDVRSRLSIKAPNTYFSMEQFPFIDEREIDRAMQDAYGFCRGVPGTCINRNMLYDPPGQTAVFNDYFQFRFARTVSQIHEVWVLRGNDTWIQVFPGLGIPGNNDPESPDRYLSVNPHPIRIVPINGNPFNVTTANNRSLPVNEGIIEIWWSQCMRDNSGHLERRNGEPERVKMTGVFVDKHNPGDIIADIVSHYGNLPFTSNMYHQEEWYSEKQKLADIGFCMSDSRDIFDWIERIQNASNLGFQMGTYRDLFTIRVDDPDRDLTFDFKMFDIENRDELYLEINGDHYASFTTINYSRDYADDEWLTHVNDSFRRQVLEVYRFEKEYTNDSFLQRLNDVKEKALTILKRSTHTRPVLRNIRISGLHWDWLKLYAMGTLDIRIDIPSRMRKLIIAHRQSRFNYVYAVQIIGVRRDLKHNCSFIDVIFENVIEPDNYEIALISDAGFDREERIGTIHEMIEQREDFV